MHNEKNDNDNVCSHNMCDCSVNNGTSYCSDYCEKAADQDLTEIKCDCGCAACS